MNFFGCINRSDEVLTYDSSKHGVKSTWRLTENGPCIATKDDVRHISLLCIAGCILIFFTQASASSHCILTADMWICEE